MRPRNLLILTLVVLGLGAFILFVERDRPVPEERQSEARRLFPLNPEAVQALDIVPAEGPRRRVEREGATQHWRLTEPREAVADSSAVQEALGALTALGWQRQEGDFDAAALGLEPPRLAVVLETASGHQELAFGDRLPASQQVVTRRGDTVYVVDAAVLEILQQPVADWRARDLLPGSRYQIEGVRLIREARESETLEFRRQGLRESFEVQGGGLEAPDRADAQRMAELLGELEGLRVATFLDDADPATLGLVPPTATVEVQMQAESEPFRLELGTNLPESGAVYARSGEQIFTLRSALPALVALPPAAWQSLDLTPLDPFEIEAITLRDPQGTLALVRKEGIWQQAGEKAEEVEEIGASAVANLIDALAEARARRLVPGSSAVQGAAASGPSLTVELRGRDGTEGPGESQTLTFQPGGEGEVAVRDSGRSSVLLWNGDSYQELEQRIAAVREP